MDDQGCCGLLGMVYDRGVHSKGLINERAGRVELLEIDIPSFMKRHEGPRTARMIKKTDQEDRTSYLSSARG